MKKLLFLTVLFFSVFSFGQTIKNTLVDFSTLKVFNGIRVEVIKSAEQSLEISGEKSDKVEIKNQNGLLRISLVFPEVSADGKTTVKVYYNKNITHIEGNESAIVNAKDINQDELVVTATERAFINLSAKVKKLTINAISGAVVQVTGTAETQEVETDLYGVYNGFQMLTSQNSTVFAGTGAKAEVSPGKKLVAKVNFGGSIFYKGEPELIKEGKVAGGIIKKRN